MLQKSGSRDLKKKKKSAQDNNGDENEDSIAESFAPGLMTMTDKISLSWEKVSRESLLGLDSGSTGLLGSTRHWSRDEQPTYLFLYLPRLLLGLSSMLSAIIKKVNTLSFFFVIPCELPQHYHHIIGPWVDSHKPQNRAKHVVRLLTPDLPYFFDPLSALAGCYFPLEFQGEFLTQSMTSREIAYSSLSVLFDSIPSWGTCHRRLGHHVILEENDQTCFKCISMVSRSPNVIQIHSNGIDQCHPTEELARQNCPTQQEVRERKAQEMMFYKTRAFYGGSAISKTYCPLNGKFKFTYSINDGTEDDLECHEPLSEATDCPTGYKFDLHFKGCSFPDFGKFWTMTIPCRSAFLIGTECFLQIWASNVWPLGRVRMEKPIWAFWIPNYLNWARRLDRDIGVQ